VLKFPSSSGVDPAQWPQGKVLMGREQRQSQSGGDDSETPAHGAGSVYGKAAREKARKQRQAMREQQRQQRAGTTDQPWMMRVEGGEGSAVPERSFRSQPSEGTGRYADYWLLSKSGNEFHATKISNWHQLQPSVVRKTLDIEDVEAQFQQRGRVLNTFALSAQIQKQLGMVSGEDGGEDGGGKGGKKGVVSKKGLVIKSEGGESGDDDDEGEESEVGF